MQVSGSGAASASCLIANNLQVQSSRKRGPRAEAKAGLFSLPALPVFRQPAELVDLGEAFWGEAPGVRAVAAPVGQFPDRYRENAPGRIDPGQPVFGLERLHVGQTAVLVALQPHA